MSANAEAAAIAQAIRNDIRVLTKENGFLAIVAPMGLDEVQNNTVTPAALVFTATGSYTSRCGNPDMIDPATDNPVMANLAAGNACRLVGRYDDAITLYEMALSVPATGRTKIMIERQHDRARACIAAIKQFEALDLARVADGTHSGTATSYAGPLTVAVTVKGGKIVRVKVTRHKDKQYYGAITETPAEIVRKQSVNGVDAVTGATITSEAIVNATAKALAGAVR